MGAAELVTFLIAYAITAAVATSWRVLPRPSLSTVGVALGCCGAVVGTAWLATIVDPAEGGLGFLRRVASGSEAKLVVAAGLGGAAALPWLSLLFDTDPGGLRRALLFAVALCGVGVGAVAFVWDELFDIRRPSSVSMLEPGFVIDEAAILPEPPIRIAAGGPDRVFVSYSYDKEDGVLGGSVVEVRLDRETGIYGQRVVIDATFLFSPLGLAYRSGTLYVSHSGLHSRATGGRIEWVPTGAVTALLDRDGDGIFEYAHDVVTGLPGMRGPNTTHQNGGIAFGPRGELFIGNGSADERVFEAHPWAGTILRAELEAGTVEVFARGFRNPFGVATGPRGDLFVTDQDFEENPGDELDHVVGGEHYGHPFVTDERRVISRGFRAPIYRSSGDAILTGLAYSSSDHLPEHLRGCLFVTSMTANEVLRVSLEPDGDTFRVTGVAPFARIPSPLDIAVTPEGDFWVISRWDRKIFRIAPAHE